MTDVQLTRRRFLADTGRLGTVGWLALQLPLVETFAACAREAAPFVTLTPAEARSMRAFAAQIIPSAEGTPGAEEAGAVYFVDRALGTPYFAADARTLRTGLADLDRRARESGAREGFASLTVAKQIAIMRAIETGPFFATARTLVIIGTFADASYGGNRGGVGWSIIGMEHQASYVAPFGWYDAQQSQPAPAVARRAG
jgi:gluconate 2-dehydrogenase gamma chain